MLVQARALEAPVVEQRTREGAATRDTSDAGEPGLEAQPLQVIGNLPRQFLNELRPLGTGADKCHLAADHVPKLRQLIQARQS